MSFVRSGSPAALAVGFGAGAMLGVLAPSVAPTVAPIGRAFTDALRLLAPLTLLTIVPVALASLPLRGSGPTIRAAAWRALGLALVAAGIGVVVGAVAPLPAAPAAMTPPSPWRALTRSLDDLALVALVLVIPLAWSIARASTARPNAQWPLLMTRAAEQVRVLLDVLLFVAPLGVAALAVGLAASAPAAIVSTLAGVGLLVWGSQLLTTVALLGAARSTGGPLQRFVAVTRDAMLTAFVTGSSAATLPVEWRAAEQGLGVPASITGVVIPAGGLVSKIGTTAFLAALGMAALRWSGLPVDGSALVAGAFGAVALGAVTPPVNGGGLVMLGVQAAWLGAEPGLAPVLIAIPLIGKLNTPLNVLGRLAIASSLDRRSAR